VMLAAVQTAAWWRWVRVRFGTSQRTT
jgi:hypothetical protein